MRTPHTPRARPPKDAYAVVEPLLAVSKSTSVSGAPDNSSLSHFSAMTQPRWLRRAVRKRHRHAIEQASRRWHGGRRDDSARARVKFDFHTVFGIMHWGHRPSGSSSSAGRGRVTSKAATTTVFPRPVRKSTSEAGVPDNSSRGHFSAVSKKRREFGFSHCLTPISSARMPPGSCVNCPPVGRSVTNSARRRGSKKCWPSQD